MSTAHGISLDEAAALAKSGDAEAQYVLSSELHERKHFDESLLWLRQSAAQGFIPAQLTLAAILMDGRQCPRDCQQAIELLRPLAASQVQANLLLGEVYGFAAFQMLQREQGLKFLWTAAQMGDAGALRQLALLCVCHRRWEFVRSLLDAAARRGDGAASYALACCYRDGVGGRVDLAVSLGIARGDAARSQYLGTPLEINIFAQNPHCAAAVSPVLHVDWALLERALPQLATNLQMPTAEILHGAPLIQKFPGVIHPLVLDALINLAQPLVQRSHIVDARTGRVRIDPMRNSFHVTLGPWQHDHVIEALEDGLSEVCGISSMNGEYVQILRYRPGEEFRPHVDYFNESGAGIRDSLADGGQRGQTVLMYLNDDYEGGETVFPRLGLRIKGHRGDILHFHNLGHDGRGHQDSLHAGLPVEVLEKWLLSKWVRVEPYPPRQKW